MKTSIQKKYMTQKKQVVYKVYYCKVHKKIIHYVESGESGFHLCWDCVYDTKGKEGK